MELLPGEETALRRVMFGRGVRGGMLLVGEITGVDYDKILGRKGEKEHCIEALVDMERFECDGWLSGWIRP